ncbi:hypothetical protein KC19_9G083100 [Ceratodon purpureus]|uniref:Uncharacterized protein n=1 Tax=Ceratodon purpureus TaxID=3225 RepID=A0A8T0GRX7_CERPU|nr:hypothetical protein KC19_9G083100 [Ceratodon purpureus]
MSLVRQSLGFSSCGVSHPSSGFKHRGVAGAWLLPQFRTQHLPRTQPLRVANVVRSGGEPYPSGESEVASVVLGQNQVAPPVGNVFGTEVKEVGILEDPVGFFKYRLERKAQSVRQAFESVEDTVKPSPYSPTQGNDVVVFVCVSVFLALSFWLGNYVVPTWIFKETVFRNSGGNVDEEEYVPEDEPSEEEVDPADLIELPRNLMPFQPAAVAGFKAGRQKARDAEEKRRKKAEKRK